MENLPPVLATNADAAIVVEGLTKLYDKFSAVTDLSFAVRPGEVWCVPARSEPFTIASAGGCDVLITYPTVTPTPSAGYRTRQ